MDNKLSKIIGCRINAQLAAQGKKQKDLAKHLGVTDNTVSYFASGARTPNLNQLCEIAKYFNVSTDYLLGLTPHRTSDKDIRAICDYTGLSEEAVRFLHSSVLSLTNKTVSNIFSLYTCVNSMSLGMQVYSYHLLLKEEREYLSKQLRLLQGEKVNISGSDYLETEKNKDLIMFRLQEMNKDFLVLIYREIIEEIENLKRETEKIIADIEKSGKPIPDKVIRFAKYMII